MKRLAALLALSGTPAAAHGNLPGGGGFSSGFAHPFLASEHLLVLIAVGVLVGRQAIRAPVFALLAGLAAGVGLNVAGIDPAQGIILSVALAIGGLLAANLHLRDDAVVAAAGLVGLVVGADTDGFSGLTGPMALMGLVTGVLAIVLNTMAFAQFGAGRLHGVPVRVAGSWIAAAAVLILAFLARSMFDIA